MKPKSREKVGRSGQERLGETPVNQGPRPASCLPLPPEGQTLERLFLPSSPWLSEEEAAALAGMVPKVLRTFLGRVEVQGPGWLWVGERPRLVHRERFASYLKGLVEAGREYDRPARDSKAAGQWSVARFQAMQRGIIPRRELEPLSSHELSQFLREEDPARWPPGLGHLARFADLHKA